ncbi:MAG: hypothetical protein OXL41_14545 [Nitrospinae bacterium]|nr:hypothetical protein [Nitrospinota bacterium]
MGIRTRDRNRTGWRAVLDPGAWLRSLLLTAVFVVFLSALACAVGLASDTTGHDWSATSKLFGAEILLALGFDARTPVRYRTRDGKDVTLTRGDLWFSGEALVARKHLLRTAKRAAWLGAWCGLGAALMCLALIRRKEDERGERRSSREPLPKKPNSVSLAPVRAPADRPPGPDAPRPGKPRPTVTDRRDTAPDRKNAPAPARRERNYGRWI